MANKYPDYKIVVLGAPGVGKSALVCQYVSGIFVERYDPTIEDSYRKLYQDGQDQVMLEILDTAQARFSAMRDLYMKHGHGFILVYSVTSPSSFDDLDDIKNQISRVKDIEMFPMVLVGTKIDLQEARKVTVEQGQTLARRYGCPFVETSARTKDNVDEVFTTIVRQISLMRPEIRGSEKPKSRQSRCIIM